MPIARGFCLFLNLLICSTKSSTNGAEFIVKTPPTVVEKADSYICYSNLIPKERIYITGFVPTIDSSKIHHFAIFRERFGRDQPKGPNCYFWSDERDNHFIYSWGGNAEGLNMPANSGFEVGTATEFPYIVIQAHYSRSFKDSDESSMALEYTESKPEFLAFTMIVEAEEFQLPPRQKQHSIFIRCPVNVQTPVLLYSLRIHGHGHSRLATVYYKSPKYSTIQKIYERSPQRPQVWDYLKTPLELTFQDELIIRCSYDTSDTDTVLTEG